MTINEAIEIVDELKPNSYSNDSKIKWLSTLDSTIKLNILNNYSENEGSTFNGYDGETDLDTVLLAPEPFDQMYIFFLQMQIDYYNEDYTRYNNSKAMYENQYNIFENWYNRNRTVKTNGFRWF